MKKLIWFLAFITALAACQQSTKKTADVDENIESVASAYTYQQAFTTLKWTAFKTTDRLAVNGSFKTFDVIPGMETGSVKDILNGLEFSIPVSSSYSAEEERDTKIAKFFYGTMLNTDNIVGTIVSTSGPDSAGTARVAITMNDMSYEVDASYVLAYKTLTLTAKLFLGDWKAEPSVQSLNEACEELHKGEGLKSKFWPEVEVMIESVLRTVETMTEDS